MLGNSLIGYLYKKNFQGIALNLVKNLKAKFSLAIDSGNLEVLSLINSLETYFKGGLQCELAIRRK